MQYISQLWYIYLHRYATWHRLWQIL